MEQEERHLSLAEACSYLSISERLLMRYMKEGRIEGFRLPNGYWRFPISELNKVLVEADPFLKLLRGFRRFPPTHKGR